MEGAEEKERAHARAVADAVDALAAAHAASIAKGLGKNGKLDALAGEPWVGELIRLLEEFEGVPACEAFAKEHAKALDGLRKGATEALQEWWRTQDKKPDKACAAGRDLLEHGFLAAELPKVLAQCREWLSTSAVELKPKEQKAFEEAARSYEAGRKQGFEAFVDRGKRFKVVR